MRTKRFLLRILMLYLIFGIAVMPVTTSYFMDLETSTGNEFSASSLDFSLEEKSGDDLDEDLFDDEIDPHEIVTKEVVVVKDGDLSFEYEISMQQTGGSTDLCNALKVSLEQDETDVYDGYLSNLDSLTLTLSGNDDEIDFEVYFDDEDEDLQNETCEFDLVFETLGSGFSDEEEIISNEVRTGWWIDPTVEVEIPNGGEEYDLGDTIDIEWDAESTDSSATAGMKIDIYLSTDSGATYPTQLADDTENDGVWGWTITVKSATMRIKIVAEDEHGLVGEDESDDDFDPEESDGSDGDGEEESSDNSNDGSSEGVESSVDEGDLPEAIPPEDDSEEGEDDEGAFVDASASQEKDEEGDSEGEESSESEESTDE